MSDEFETPTCDKCGAEITTGLMVCLCPCREQCAFWDEAWSADIKASVRRSWESGNLLDALS